MLILWPLLVVMQVIQMQSISAVELFPQTNTISASTNYELKMLLNIVMPIGTKVTMDFSSTDIGVISGPLTKCTSLNVFNLNDQTEYTQCTCTTTSCTITTSTQVSSGSFFWLRFGSLTNPNFVKSQTVQLSVNFGTSTTNQQLVVDVYSGGDLALSGFSQSSFKVNALNDLGMSLKTSHPIESGGKIIIMFPVQIGFKSISVLGNVNGAVNATGIISATTTSVTVSGILSTAISVGSTINLYIMSTQNQESVRSSNSITVQTATSNSYLVDQVGVVVQTTIPESIAVNFVGVTSNSNVNSITTFQFTLQPAVKFIGGGYLEITFPPQLSIKSDMTCIRILGLTTVTGSSYSCGINGQVVRTSNLQYPNVANQLILTVSSIQNPSSMKPTDSFQFKTYDVDGYLICVSSVITQYTATYGVLNAIISRVTTTVGVQSQYTIKINNNDSIPNNGAYIVNLGTQAYRSTTLCDIACTYISDTQIKIILSATAANSDITIKLSNLLNPNFISIVASDLSIKSVDSEGYGIGQQLSIEITPVLTPIVMLSIDLYRTSIDGVIASTSSMSVCESSIVNIVFDVPSTYISSNDGHVLVSLNGYYIKYPTENIVCQQLVNGGTFISRTCTLQSYVSQTSPQLNLINVIKIPNICSIGTCTDKIQLKISGIRVELNTGVIQQSIGIDVNTVNDELVGRGNNSGGTLVFTNNPIADSVISISTTSSITGIINQYTLQFITTIPIDISDRSGSIKITIPQQIGITGTSNCIATVDSITLICNILTNIITITSTQDPFIFLNNKIIIVTISQVRNPYSIEPTDNIIIEQLYNTDRITAKYQSKVTMITPQTLIVQLVRTPDQISKNAKLNIQFTLNNVIDSLVISLAIPMDQIVANTLQLTKSNDIVIATQINNSNGEYTIVFTESTCPCTIGQVLTYQLSGFSNPTTTKELTSKASIQLRNNNGFAYQLNSAIIIPSVFNGDIIINSITQSGSQLNSNTIISIQFTISSQFNTLLVKFTNNIPWESQQSKSISIQLNNNILTCTYDTTSGYSIRCISGIVNIGVQIISISNINTISWLSQLQSCNLNIITYMDTYVVDKSADTDCKNLLQLPTTTFTSSIVRSNRFLSQQTNLIVSIPQHKMVQYVNIQLPLSEVQNDPQFKTQESIIPIITIDQQHMILKYKYDPVQSNDITINLLNLLNANTNTNTQSNYIIILSIDGITSSYISQGYITPILQCTGLQCGNEHIDINKYSKSTTLISTLTDITMTIILPIKQSDIKTLTINSTSTEFNGICSINQIVYDCNTSFGICTDCTTKQLDIKVLNALNSDLFNPTDKVCVSIQTISELVSTCKSFPMLYNDGTLSISTIKWTNTNVYSQNAVFEFTMTTNTIFTKQIPTYLDILMDTNQQIDFTTTSIYFNTIPTTFTYIKPTKLTILICQSGCTKTINNIQITGIQLFDTILTNGLFTKFTITRQDQQLQQTSIVNTALFPKLLPNLLIVSATAIDYVQLSYKLESTVPYSNSAIINFIFNNGCQSSSDLTTIHNSTCFLKSATINNVQLFKQSVITHQSTQNIILTPKSMECPIPYQFYKDTCIKQCPISTQSIAYQCIDCVQQNCAQCNTTACTQCAVGYKLTNNNCVYDCQLQYCSQCNTIDTNTCLQCTAPYQLYQGKCLKVDQCTLPSCEVCNIKNQQLLCIKCSNGYLMNTQCLTQCPIGYYGIDGICRQCDSKCRSCTYQQCTDCNDPYQLISGMCQCSILHCDSCTTADTCDSCFGQLVKLDNQCISQCPVDYYALAQVCHPCSSECSTCNASGCLTCHSPAILQQFKCILICDTNCRTCQDGKCTQCAFNYQLQNDQCTPLIDDTQTIDTQSTPYVGPVTLTYSSIVLALFIYIAVNIIMPPKVPIIPQVIICTLVVMSVAQTLGSIFLILYTLITDQTLMFILVSAAFCMCNLMHSSPTPIVTNPIVAFITAGASYRAPLSKLKPTTTDPRCFSNYLLVRHAKQRQLMYSNVGSLLIGVVVIAVQSPNELPYLAAVKMLVDLSICVSLLLEIKMI